MPHSNKLASATRTSRQGERRGWQSVRPPKLTSSNRGTSRIGGTFSGPESLSVFPRGTEAGESGAVILRSQPSATTRELVVGGDNDRLLVLKLLAALSEAGVDGWDGYGGRRIPPEALSHSVRFLRALPAAFEAPDVVPSAAGEITLEWFRGPRHNFTVSIGSEPYLAYAGLFGKGKVHGVEPLSEEVPEMVQAALRRLYPD
jgi:hypothetical protein